MKKGKFILILVVVFIFPYSNIIGQLNEIMTRTGEEGRPITIMVTKGKGWNHSFKFSGLIEIRTTPQFAIWIEDSEGNHISTLAVTRKLAKEEWEKVPFITVRRKESLPYWAHKHGVTYDDGLYVPTKRNPLPDAITCATPSGNFILRSLINKNLRTFAVVAEINQSHDFNEFYAKDIKSGMEEHTSSVNGQPALVYRGIINVDERKTTCDLLLIGHSSPDGTDGNLYTDLSKITTAKEIVEKITVEIR